MDLMKRLAHGINKAIVLKVFGVKLQWSLLTWILFTKSPTAF